MTGRKNIKLDEDLFDELKADKGKHKSWPQYFRENCLSDDGSGDVSEATEAAKAAEANTEEIKRRLDQLCS